MSWIKAPLSHDSCFCLATGRPFGIIFKLQTLFSHGNDPGHGVERHLAHADPNRVAERKNRHLLEILRK
ncbi:hypothetical protein AMTR_s00059p00155300 [Amborella trichopoda]|uniref:Uncharacterized protein n=1 Tax=Amborella trichopoda TaxID=13333 RepID=U5CWA6_AMBTC|nr:hypothetical protein AMTR_s00059p00155300 [Amborella trichopoda]